MATKSRVTRRDFVRGAAVVLAGAGLAACTPTQAPAEPTQVPVEVTTAPETVPTTDISNRNLEEIIKLADTKVQVRGWHPRMWVSDNSITGLQDQIFDKKMEELTNVHINWTSEAGGGPAFDVMMAGGDLPDMMCLGGDLNTFSSYGAKGAFISINDYVDANPYLAKRYNANPTARAMSTAPDGKIYFFPRILEGIAKTFQGLTIRGDWLDEAGMQAPPATTDELYEWAKACKAKDAKRFPIFFGWQFPNCSWIFWQWGVDNGFVREGDQVQFGPLMPQYAEAMTYVQRLHKEGLIDPNWAQATADSLTRDMTTGVSGLVNATQDNIPIFLKGLPDAKWRPMGKPKGPYGHHQDFGEYGEIDRWSGNVIAASSKSKDILAKYCDLYLSDSGATLQYYGVYGDTYTEVDGKKIWTDKVVNSGLGRNEYCYTFIGPNYFGAAYLSGQTWLDLNPGLPGEAVKLWAESDPPAVTQSQLPDLIMTQEEQDTLKTIMPDIQTAMQEYYAKAIARELNTTSDHAAFVNQAKSMGIENAVKIYQAAYDRYRALLK